MTEITRPTVYLETSVVSYLAARPRRDATVAVRQALTKRWFATSAHRCDLYVSEVVLSEAGAGDPLAAAERLAWIVALPVLAVNADVAHLAGHLVGAGVVPPTAADDALHIAVAAAHGLDYLVTWNCRHIANASMRSAIEGACRSVGFEPPIICTPEELDLEARG